jgi:hypothetical protein
MLSVDDTISKGMVSYASKVPRESIIEVKAKVIIPEKPVEFWVINKSAPILPF